MRQELISEMRALWKVCFKVTSGKKSWQQQNTKKEEKKRLNLENKRKNETKRTHKNGCVCVFINPYFLGGLLL